MVSLHGAYNIGAKSEITERAYIVLTDLQKVRHVQNLMRDLDPEINENIPKEEYRAIMKTLRKWEVSLQDSFEVNGEG